MRILIIEDEHKIAQSLKKGLEQESYAVDLAFTGTEGLDLALGEVYDMIILDRMLPELDGLEIVHQIRKAGNHVPILLLTAKSQVQDRVAGLDSGADDYLTKPFAFEELLARIRALKRRPSDTIQTILTVDDLELNTNTYEVRRASKSIQLSNKEYALLEYMMRNPGKVLTKEQIMNHIWNYEADILPNTVEVYIGYLRSKIDKPFPHKPDLIKTVRGFGYKLEGEGPAK